MKNSSPALLWLGIGFFLFGKGILFLLNGSELANGLFLFSLALGVGYLKGRTVLKRTVAKLLKKVQEKGASLKWSDIYDKKYLGLIGLMMLVGFSFNYFSIPIVVRGFIDVAIGSALITGSIFYFRGIYTNNLKNREYDKEAP